MIKSKRAEGYIGTTIMILIACIVIGIIMSLLILRKQLDNLDKDYALLKMQAQELIVRNNKSQINLPLVA